MLAVKKKVPELNVWVGRTVAARVRLYWRISRLTSLKGSRALSRLDGQEKRVDRVRLSVGLKLPAEGVVRIIEHGITQVGAVYNLACGEELWRGLTTPTGR